MLPPTRRLTARLTSRVAWACLAAAAVALLAIGSIHPPPTTAAARIAHLDSIIRCPSCEDLSLTQSDAASSLTLRREVASWVHQGWSDNRIEQAVVARYGQAGLLLPQSSGAAAALYIVPLAIVGAAAAGVGLFLWRRRRGDAATRARREVASHVEGSHIAQASGPSGSTQTGHTTQTGQTRQSERLSSTRLPSCACPSRTSTVSWRRESSAGLTTRSSAPATRSVRRSRRVAPTGRRRRAPAGPAGANGAAGGSALPPAGTASCSAGRRRPASPPPGCWSVSGSPAWRLLPVLRLTLSAQSRIDIELAEAGVLAGQIRSPWPSAPTRRCSRSTLHSRRPSPTAVGSFAWPASRAPALPCRGG